MTGYSERNNLMRSLPGLKTKSHNTTVAAERLSGGLQVSVRTVNPQKLLIAAMIISVGCVLGGCGHDEALDEYKESMETYYEQIAAIDEGINSLDPSADPEGTQLLAYLDELDSVTAQMAELEVPTQFASVENLADEASENMTQAVQLYHQLYASEEYNEDLASGAYEYYERANMRIRYITDILHGDIPEELQEMMQESDEGSEEE